MKNKKTFIKICVVVLALFIIILSIYIYSWEFRKPLIDIYIFSLNKGRAIFIRTPENKTILIGGGQNSEVIRELTKVMPFYSRKIDKVIIPSAVPAQIGGLIEIVNRYSIDEIIMPKPLATSTVLNELIKEIGKKKIHIEEVERGDEIKLEKDLNLNVLFPYEDYKFNKSSLPELGFSISYFDTAMYFFGNLSKAIQKDIAKSQADTAIIQNNKPDQNLVEFYNNGGDTKVAKELINLIKPKYIWNTKEKTSHYFSEGEEWVKE